VVRDAAAAQRSAHQQGAVGNDKSGSQRVMAGNEKEQFRSFLDMPYCQPAGWNG
jgi:hypothetical protein